MSIGSFSCRAPRGLDVVRGWEALAVSVAPVAVRGCVFAGGTWVEEGILAVERETLGDFVDWVEVVTGCDRGLRIEDVLVWFEVVGRTGRVFLR